MWARAGHRGARRLALPGRAQLCGEQPGVRAAAGSGISWVFEQVDEAIILEDDCVPDPTFFRFCEELLEKYREDERVINIEASNWQWPPPPSHSSYFFSIFNITWGWATWRRAWQYYDPAVRLWPEVRDTSWLLDLVRDARVAQMFAHAFERAYAAQGELDFWDYQWTFTCWAHHGLSILPTTALVERTWDLGLRRRIRSRWGMSGLGCRRGPWAFRCAILPQWSQTAPPISTSSSA